MFKRRKHNSKAADNSTQKNQLFDLGFLKYLIFDRNRIQGRPYPGRGDFLGVDSFFGLRVLGFIGIGLMLAISLVAVSIFTLGWVWSPTMIISIAALVFCSVYAFKLYYIALTHRYFVIELICVHIHFQKAHENVKEFFNPSSQTFFRSSQRVTFTTADEKRIVFTFEKTRKFIEGSKYAFYFRLPSSGDIDGNTLENLTVLKIDHYAIPQKAFELAEDIADE